LESLKQSHSALISTMYNGKVEASSINLGSSQHIIKDPKKVQQETFVQYPTTQGQVNRGNYSNHLQSLFKFFSCQTCGVAPQEYQRVNTLQNPD
jgi:hypothetical protein